MTSVSMSMLLFRFSCGNNIHISCMKVWADHQMKLNSHGMLKCPLCRDDFGTLKQLNEEVKYITIFCVFSLIQTHDAVMLCCVCQVRNSTDVCSYYERECLDKHLGVVCNGCGVCPVVGKCFK